MRTTLDGRGKGLAQRTFTLEMDVSAEPAASMLGGRQLMVLEGTAEAPEFRELRSLSQEEWDDYTICFALLTSLQTAGRLFNAAAENFAELEQAFTAFRSAAEHAGDEAIRSFFDDLINRRLTNYLSSVRTFLDHVEYRLRRVYGSDSNELAGLKLQCSRLYDEHFAYRFAYKLRNYSQHFGNPVWTVAFSSSALDPTTDEITYFATASFDVPALLVVGRDCWGAVRQDLQTLPDRLDVMTVIGQLPVLIHSVWLTHLDVQKDKVEGAAAVVESILATPEPGYVVASEWIDRSGSLALEFYDRSPGILDWFHDQLSP